jgi:serine protease Do
MSRAVALFSLLLVASVSAVLGLLAGGGGVVSVSSAPVRFAGAPPSFAEIVANVNPAVVHVDVIEDAVRRNVHEGVEDAPDVEAPGRGEGSGFIVDPSGYILTNHHLVPGPARVRVRLTDKRELPARLVGSDPSTDLALLKVEGTGLPAVTLGDSDRIRVGDWVCAIGNPLSFDHTVTVGVVSSKGRKIFNASFDSYIQTDAAINPGNSGGPLINAQGEAVGINAAVSSEGQGIGFAIPINLAKSVLEQLRATGHVSRGYLGIQLHELDPDLQKMLGLREPRGALVLEVIKGGAGETAGLKRYDVITRVSGRGIADGDDLVRTIAAMKPGTSVSLEVVRDGKLLAFMTRLSERQDEEEAGDPVKPPPATPASRGDALGLVVGEMALRARSEPSVPADRKGVVVRDVVGLDPGTDALEEGDLIVEVNRVPTPDAPSYRKVLATLSPGQSAWLYVYRPRPAGSFLTRVEVEKRK